MDINFDNTGFRRHCQRMADFARNVEITELLYQNKNGLTIGELIRHTGLSHDRVWDMTEELVRADILDYDRRREMFSFADLGFKFCDTYEPDSTITVVSRIQRLVEQLLPDYANASQEQDREGMAKRAKAVMEFLDVTFQRTRREIRSLRDRVEDEYIQETNLSLKVKSLEVYLQSLSDIKFALDVECREITDGEGKKVRLNLMKVLTQDGYFGMDYKGFVESFEKNCNSILYNQILDLYNQLRDWLGKTRLLLKDLDDATIALKAMVEYNKANERLHRFVTAPGVFLPPVHRTFHNGDKFSNCTESINVSSRIISLEDIDETQYQFITHACSRLGFDFVGFKPYEDEDAPVSMDGPEPEPEEIEYIDFDSEMQAFAGSELSLLEFLRSRYPDWSDEKLHDEYFGMLFSPKDVPILFNATYDVGFRGEMLNDVYEVVSVFNK